MKLKVPTGVEVHSEPATPTVVKVVEALKRVNGAATAHTYSATDIVLLAKWAETRLENLGIAKADRKGAKLASTSGERVAAAYMKRSYGPRIATHVVLERGSSCWYLTDVARDEVWERAGKSTLWLTPEQDDLACRAVRAQYKVVPAPVPEQAAA